MANSPNIEVSVVMPCLNEAETVGLCIRKALSAFSIHNISGEVIVADNGSTDASVEIAKLLGARVVVVQQKGYGAALSGGILAAQGHYIVMGDADDSYDFSSIFPFIQKLRDGCELVVGCRLPAGGGIIKKGAMPFLHRWLGNPILTSIGKFFFGSNLSDFHCGLRAFRRGAFVKMALRTTGMEFASEMIIKATLLKMKISEVPITLYKDGRGRPPHLRTWRDGWRHLRFMLLYSPRWLFLVPGITLLLLGILLGIPLLLGPIKVGVVAFDTNTLLILTMCILIGFQLLTFAVLAKVFAISEGFLPSDYRIAKMFKIVKLETGIIVGFVFAVVGFGLLAIETLSWKNHNFGPISYPESLRMVIPGITCLTLGVQIVFSSFLLSILAMHRR